MWAPIGLKDIMNTGGAVLSPGSLERDSEVTRTHFQSRGPGSFVAFTNTKRSRVEVGCDESESIREIPFTYDDETGELSFRLPEENSHRAAHNVAVEWRH